MSISFYVANSDFDTSKIIIDNRRLEALDSALDHATRALELQISELNKVSLIDGVMQAGIIATMARESIDSYRKSIEALEEFSGKIYDHLTGYGSKEYREAASR